MANKKIVEVEIKENFEKVNKNVEAIVDSLNDVKEAQDKVTESVQKSEKATEDLSGGFKALGIALKGAGIGLAIETFNEFKEAVAANQRVSDKFNTTLGATKIIFNDLLDKATDWDKLKKLLMTEVNGDFFKKAGDYFKNVGKTAEKQVELQNEVKLAIVEQQGLVEKGDVKAEKFRQIRDNDNLSIQTRIQANKNLGVALDEQAAAMTKLGNKQKELADLNVKINNNIENQVAQKEAQNNLDAIAAQITGLRSEQLINEIALKKESNALDAEATDDAIARAKSRIDTNTSLMKNEEERRLQEIFDIQSVGEYELKILDERRKKYAQNTPDRIAADNAYRTKSQELDNNLKVKRDELDSYLIDSHLNNLSIISSNEFESYSIRLKALNEYNKVAQKSTQISEDEKRRISMETVKQERVLQKERLDMVSNTLGNMASLFEQGSTAGKAFAISQSLINTFQGITAELATKTATPFEFGLKVANIATTAAIGFKAVQDIINTPSMSEGGSANVSASGGAVASAPQFNVVGASGVNQLAQSINSRENQPVKAYVVASEVTSQQSLDRNKVSSASLG